MMNTQLQKARAIIAARDEEIEELRKDRDWWLEKRQKAEKAITDLPVHIANVDYYKAQCDALAAEVARLTAENAALRAQLDAAGEGWRPIDELDITQDVEAEIMMRATYQHEYGTWDSRKINILHTDADYWRPAPPQE